MDKERNFLQLKQKSLIKKGQLGKFSLISSGQPQPIIIYLAVYPRYTVTADTMTADRCLITGALLPLIRQSIMFGPTRCASPTPNAKRY